jgi:hypothetical protein
MPSDLASVSPYINRRIAQPTFLKLDRYIIAPVPVSAACLLILSQDSMCRFVYPFIVIETLDKSLPRQRIQRNNETNFGGVVFYAVSVI